MKSVNFVRLMSEGQELHAAARAAVENFADICALPADVTFLLYSQDP